MLILLAACTQAPVDTAPATVPWSADRPPLAAAGWLRSVAHLHSPFSHDACDGAGWSDEAGVDLACLADLRAGLCRNGFDVAFLTDHPSHLAFQDYSDLLLLQDGDDDLGSGARWQCPDGHSVLVLPGTEDTVMAIGLSAHVPGTPQERDVVYNAVDADALATMRAAGALLFQNHPEGLELDVLAQRMTDGLSGMEVFNLHAMFAPDIRVDDLGLSATGWTQDIAPFTSPDGTAEPDLLFLGVHQEQTVTIERFDALWDAGFDPTPIGGTDAHQNVLNLELRDGERVDSYRRMLSWFSTWIQGSAATPDDARQALAAGRTAVVFEALGVPDTLGATLDGDTLTVPCAALAATSPRGVQDPLIETRVFHDGVLTDASCGSIPVSAGVWRVELWITPYHLVDFLGDDPDPFLHAYPWVVLAPVRVE